MVQYQLCSVSQKNPLRFSEIFSQTVGHFFINFLQAYYMVLSTLDYTFLFKYLQL